jgi:multiple sugar transport system ATP-binding protein
MRVFDNIGYPLKIRKLSKAAIREQVMRAAEILQIPHLTDRLPRELSGGERQRVALARAIVREPNVFLFDEPLSNLDAKLRVQMRTEIKKIHQRVQTTVVYVTHDQIEAMTLADRIVVMNDGVIEQVGTPDDMYSNPQTHFVASFIGSPSMNFMSCHLTKTAGGLAVRLADDVSLAVPDDRASRYEPYADKEMTFGIRPEHVTERRPHANGAQQDIDANVNVLEPMGVDTMVFFSLGPTEICARAEPNSVGNVGESMGFTVNMDKMHLIDPSTGTVVLAANPLLRESLLNLDGLRLVSSPL